MDWQKQFETGEVIYKDESGLVLCGDCLEVMKNWPDKSIELICTDPPLRINRGGIEWIS